MRRMMLFLFSGLAGCQTVPPHAALQQPPPIPIIRLCQHNVAVEEDAIKQEVLRRVATGQTIEVARTRLEALGIRLRGMMPKSYRRKPINLPELICFDKKAERIANRVFFQATCDEIGAWGQRYFPVSLYLYFDANMTVTEVEVARLRAQGIRTPFGWYFSRRPNLREPLGVPVEEARKLMESEGFQCSMVVVDKNEKSGRPYLHCRAIAETPLGGSIIRVRLFHDERGIVSDSFVEKDAGAFDELLCMLPNDSDTPGTAIVKTVIFPVRLYASIVVSGLEADLAMGRP